MYECSCVFLRSVGLHSECRILGHSDRCWSPSVSRTSGSVNSRHLSTFSRTRPSSQAPLQRSGYDTQTSRSVALHSLTEDQQSPVRLHSRVLSQSQRRPDFTHSPQSHRHRESWQVYTSLRLAYTLMMLLYILSLTALMFCIYKLYF